MTKSDAKIVQVNTPAEPSSNSPVDVLQSVLTEARALPPGSDVEGFIEERLSILAQATRSAIAEVRAADQAASAREADFSPSGVSGVRRADEAGPDGGAPGGGDNGPDRI